MGGPLGVTKHIKCPNPEIKFLGHVAGEGLHPSR